VVAERLLDEQHLAARLHLDDVAGHRPLGDPRVPVEVRVVRVEVVAVGGERQPEEALLAALRHLPGQIEDGLGVHLAVPDGYDAPGLLRDVERAVTAADRHAQGLVERRDTLQAETHRRRRRGRRPRGGRTRLGRLDPRRWLRVARACGGHEPGRRDGDGAHSHPSTIRALRRK
jgi:hypothetical protein